MAQAHSRCLFMNPELTLAGPSEWKDPIPSPSANHQPPRPTTFLVLPPVPPTHVLAAVYRPHHPLLNACSLSVPRTFGRD